MLLIVTNETDYTADFLIVELHRRDIDFVRFNTEDFPSHVGLTVKVSNQNYLDGSLTLHDRTIALSDIGSIWYRRPVQSLLPKEISDPAAQEFVITESRYTLDSLWRILPCFWVSHPDKLRSAETKLHQLLIAADLGFTIPNTLVTTSPVEGKLFYKEQHENIIYKPQRQAQVVREESLTLIFTNVIDNEKIELIDHVKYAPSLFQNYIPKATELRITVIGNRVLTVQIHSQDQELTQHDWRRGNSNKLRHAPYELPASVAKKCIALVKAFDLAFGAIDMILTPDGKYVFLELNPNGQWAWIEQCCPDIRIREALIDLLTSEDRTYQ